MSNKLFVSDGFRIYRTIVISCMPLRLRFSENSRLKPICGINVPCLRSGQLGSCTANAIGAAFEFELKRQNQSSDFMLRVYLFILMSG